MKGDRKARGLAAFDRKRKRLRLAATTAKRHKVRGLGRGNKTSSVRRKFRGRVRSIGRGRLFVRTRAGGIVFGSRKGKVTYVAIVDRTLAKSRKKTRALPEACQASLGGRQDGNGPSSRSCSACSRSAWPWSRSPAAVTTTATAAV